MRRVLRFPAGPLALCGLLVGATGCEAPARLVAENLPPLTRTSWDAYRDARSQWAQVYANGLRGEQRVAALQDVLTTLRQALDASADSPLILTKRAEVLMELGPQEDAAAAAELRRAFEREPDWAPAWYDAAWLVLRRDDLTPADLAEAQLYVEELEEATARLATWNPRPHDENYVPEEEAPPGTYEPFLPEAARKAAFLEQINAYFEWSRTNKLLLAEGAHASKAAGGGGVGIRWLDKLKARTLFLKLVIEAHEMDYRSGAPSMAARLQEMAEIIRNQVFHFDGEFVHARQFRARILHALGMHVQASDQIQALVDRSQNPMLSNDPELLNLALQIHADWLIERLREMGGEGVLRDDPTRSDLLLLVERYAQGLLGTPHDAEQGIAPDHPQGMFKWLRTLLEIVQHAVRAGDDALYDVAVPLAQGYLDAAYTRIPDGREEIEELRSRLDALKKERRPRAPSRRTR